ncbi:MAG: SDR family oxidoreductase [Actinomycetia bacterium]|nr:SDR family oxidoreductase [Actinomycetes bacterium]
MSEWAVVTGASSGIGRGFAERLASQGLGLVLVARSAEALHDIADDLRSRYRVPVDVMPCDLTDAAARDQLVADLADREVGVLVNSAGFATVGDLVDTDPGRIEAEISLNVLALTMLARAFAPAMKSRRRGAIVNVASTAAFQPLPTFGVYAATKAYVLSLSQALWDELRPYGVTVLALCPGSTETAFWATAGDETMLRHRRSVDQVLDTCFEALAKGRPYVIDGLANTVLAQVSRLVPARIGLPVSRRVLRS